MHNKHDLSTCQLLLLAVLVIMSASALMSCGNDEPSPLVVDYYMNDEAVLEACDKEYATFVSLYAGQKEHMTCIMHLMKVLKRDGVVKQSEKMMTYIYDINPTEIDE